MKVRRGTTAMGLILVIALIVGTLALACDTSEPTATPAMPVAPAQPAAPTAMPQPTATLVPGAPTVIPARPTPTRVLPTATPVAMSQPVYGGAIRYAHRVAYDTLDPAYQSRSASRRVMFTVYNNLVKMLPDGTVAPELARDWDVSPDGRLVTFHLQDGVKFHDGTVLDADAVKWNYDRHLDAETGSVRRRELAPPLESVIAKDNRTIEFHLASPFRPLMATLTARAGQIASPAAVQRLDSYADRAGPFGSNPVGSGPFKFMRWIPGSEVTVAKSDNYWEAGLPYVDSIKFFEIPDLNVIFAMLRTREVDIMEELPPSDIQIARDHPDINLIFQEGGRSRILFFNVSQPPWNNKALRQAFAYAMDRETLARVMFGEAGAEPLYQPVTRSYGEWYDPSIRPYEHSPEKAREKLAEAGYPDGFSYTQPCSSSTFELQYCEIGQVGLAESGINMSISPSPSASYYSDWAAGRFTEPVWTRFTSRVDPNPLLSPYFHSEGPQNALHFSNLEFDRLLDEATAIYDLAEAKAIYREAIMILLEEAPSIYQVQFNEVFGVRSNVRNFVAYPDLEPRLRELWLQR